jgi:plexin A
MVKNTLIIKIILFRCDVLIRMGFTQTELLVCVLIGSVAHVWTNTAIISGFPSQTLGNCSISNIKKLTHLAVDPMTGRVYVGAVNRIIQLDSSLNLEACIVTGPKEDSVFCHASGCDSSAIERTVTDNVNKILVIEPEGRTIIACGSVLQGACEKFKLDNISLGSQFFPQSIAANDEMSSTYAFIGPEHYNQWRHSNVLYVGTTFTNNGEYRHDVPAIASRELMQLEIAELSISKDSQLKIDVKYRDHFLVKYIYGFNSSDYAYFVIVQKQSHLPGQEELGYVTRLARVCINDANYDSYTEVTIQCSVKDGVSNIYNLIQDAKVMAAGDDLALSLGIDPGKPVLIASFSPSKTITNEPLSHSALCVYSIADIEAKFNENIHMCFNGSIKYRNMPYISGLILDGNCPVAGVRLFTIMHIYLSGLNNCILFVSICYRLPGIFLTFVKWV